MSRTSFTDRRRNMLARRVASLDHLEPRAMITESIGVISMGIGVPAVAVAAAVGPKHAGGAEHALGVEPRFELSRAKPASHEPLQHAQAAGRSLPEPLISVPYAPPPQRRVPTGDWLSLIPRQPVSEITLSTLPASPKPIAGGAG